MELPVACSLELGDFEDRCQAWQELVAGRLQERQWTDDGCVLTLSAAPGVGTEARRLARLEADCCPWMDVRVTDDQVVTIQLRSSEPGGPETIRRLFQAS
jgi:hypothetical protein